MAEQHVWVDNALQISNATGSILETSEFTDENSLHAAGAVPSPSAGAAICVLSLPAGFYKVEVHRAADGSGTPTLYNNAAFTVGASSYTLVAVPELGILYNYTFYVSVPTTTNVSVVAPTNTSANITITASITATRMN